MECVEAWYGKVRFCFGHMKQSIIYGGVWFGLVLFGRGWLSKVRSGLVQSGCVWLCLVRCGLVFMRSEV